VSRLFLQVVMIHDQVRQAIITTVYLRLCLGVFSIAWFEVPLRIVQPVGLQDSGAESMGC
jgi:hypothetical protein